MCTSVAVGSAAANAALEANAAQASALDALGRDALRLDARQLFHCRFVGRLGDRVELLFHLVDLLVELPERRSVFHAARVHTENFAEFCKVRGLA